MHTTLNYDVLCTHSKSVLLEMCAELGIERCKSKPKSALIDLILTKQTAQTVLPSLNVHMPTPAPAPSSNAESLTATQSALNVLDLFCGCGGMSKGLTDAGLNVIAGIDVWEKAIQSYRRNFHHQGICADLTQLPPEQFNAQYNRTNQPIDIIVGGPPCQGFSIAGKRDIKDPRNSLFMEYVKYIHFFLPKAFIMENVIGILSMKTENNECVIDIILSLLSTHYNCIVTKLYASDFEVPQNRRRTIIIGIRKDLNITPVAPAPVVPNVESRTPVRTVLQPRDEVDASHFLSERALEGIRTKRRRAQANGNGFGAQILDLDKPSYTIPARYWKDGYDALVQYSDTELRKLTITELKRIQSFPDDYVIEGTKKEIIMQIGNAVACKFAYYLGKHIMNILQ